MWTYNEWYDELEAAEYGSDLSAKINYGFTNSDLLILMTMHEAGNFRKKIEDLLTDCNFHTECKLLHKKDYNSMLEQLIEEAG